jgi:maltose alpha-D-glucosyltransferase/alpha-amylase
MRVMAYIRQNETHTILCVVNLSRFVQPVSLDLSEFTGRVPIELIGEIRFPPIGEAPYFLSMGPHSFFWFRLEEQSG